MDNKWNWQQAINRLLKHTNRCEHQQMIHPYNDVVMLKTFIDTQQVDLNTANARVEETKRDRLCILQNLNKEIKKINKERDAANARLILADQMAEAFDVIKCNLDPADSKCDVSCHLCKLMVAQKTRDDYVAARKG